MAYFLWHSPTGGTAGTNTFYTESTTFDVTQAVISGTQQHTHIIRDIDAIAVQLKKLSNANVPVIWRPLHEAGGGWFWWGAKGPAAGKALYNIVYDRIVNYHGIHNLIWAWSSPEPEWYPGNDKVDLIGYDSYPGANNYTVQKPVFDQLYKIVNGEKLIAMTENGPIPDIQLAFDMDAPWSYFMSWDNLVSQQNSTAHIQEVFANASVLTVENPGTACTVTTLAGDQSQTEALAYPNPFANTLQISSHGDFTYMVYDVLGNLVEHNRTSDQITMGSKWPHGVYLIKLQTVQGDKFVKAVKQP
ncbi:MAG TPA: glycosyl hydrolase [Cytophagales bacterium]|nr:glycosyl hydrolase [Cytophagales bacterium]